MKEIYTIKDLSGNIFAWVFAKSETEAINRALLTLPSPFPPNKRENRWKADMDAPDKLPPLVTQMMEKFPSLVICADESGNPGQARISPPLGFNLLGRIRAEQYLEEDGHYCPACSSDDIEAVGEFSEESCSRLLSCARCDHQWREIWQLVGITDGGHPQLPAIDWLTVRPYQSGAYWVTIGQNVELGYFNHEKMTLRINGIELPLPAWSGIEGWRGPVNIPQPIQSK